MKTSEIESEVMQNARILWEYHVMPCDIAMADFLLVLGSNDLRVAEAAGELLCDRKAPFAIVSGGYGKVTGQTSSETEATRFANRMRAMGVPPDQILLEEQATNTGDNFKYAKNLLDAKGISVRSGIFVTKPYMQRRAFATGMKQWPHVHWLAAAPKVRFEDYPNETIDAKQMIELMVGDLQRIDIYPDMGYQIRQEIPSNVRKAYMRLIDLGFDRYILREQN